MATELKPLQEFFNKRLFRIPDYQRGYAWGLDQVKDFWDDLPIDWSGCLNHTYWKSLVD
jgi:hypothetical protein